MRLPLAMIDDLKHLADLFDRPYQAIMKEAIESGLPIVKALGHAGRKLQRDAKSYDAPHIKEALRKLKKRETF